MKPALLRLFFVACILGLVGRASAQQDQLFYATADTWIHGLESPQTHGSDTRLGICPSANYWIYLKFDLRNITGVVTRAELRLTRVQGARPEEISVYGITGDSWNQVTLSGPDRPEPRNPAPEDALVVGGVIVGQYDAWTSESLTEWINEQAQGDGIVTLMLRENPAPMVDVRYYNSREADVAETDKPLLIIASRQPVDESLADGWEMAEVARGVAGGFDIDEEGRFLVSAVEGDAAPRQLRLSKSEPRDLESAFSTTTLFQADMFNGGDVAAVGESTYVSFMAVPNGDSKLIRLSPGLAPQLVSLDTEDFGAFHRLTRDSGGDVHSLHVAQSGANRLRYARISADSILAEEVAGSGDFFPAGTAIVTDQLNRPHIAYCQLTNTTSGEGTLRYGIRSDLGNWSFMNVASGVGVGRIPSIILNQFSRPVIAWCDFPAAEPGTVTIRVGEFTGTEWDTRTVESLAGIDGLPLNQVGLVSLAKDSSGAMHLAYGTSNRIRFARRVGAQWQAETILTASEQIYLGQIRLRFDGLDSPVFSLAAETLTGEPRVRLLRRAAPHDGWRLR